MTTEANPQHCATFSDPVLNQIATFLKRYVPIGNLVLDPFAGTGKVHTFAPEWDTQGIEIEPEWAALHNRTRQGDALDLPYSPGEVDAIVTSPCYGNRMADTYLGDAKGSKRYTYTTALGRLPTDGSAAAMQWGPEYRVFHEQAWTEALRVLAPGGHFILNISDHIRSGIVQPVTTWHVATLCHAGLKMLDIVPISTRRQRHGANSDLRVNNEWVIMFAKDRMF
jgi:hypothetical protein